MPEPRSYPHGVTCWVDTDQPDLDAAARFYAGLLGWTLAEADHPLGDGAYRIATLDGAVVAGLGQSPPDVPAAWNTYVAVDDLDATVAAVRSGGGTVLRGPVDAGSTGRGATCADPSGGAFRLWQPGDLRGAQLANAPGAWNFSDLHTHDRDAAMAFYAPLFGWVAVDMAGGWTMLQVPGYGDHLAATVDPGIHERQELAPPGFADVIGGLVVTGSGEPPGWHVTFTVADRDDSVATAERLGATVLRSGEDAWTRHALLRDPQGAELTVSQFTPPDGW